MNPAVMFAALAMSFLPQQKVDVAREVLGAISRSMSTSVQSWEFRAGEGDKLRWRAVRLPDYSRVRSGSYRAEVVIPEIVAGRKITGGKAELWITLRGPVEMEAEFLLQGEPAGKWPYRDQHSGEVLSHFPLLLTKNARPGENFSVEIRFSNPGVYPANEFLDGSKTVVFRSAHIILEQAEPMRQELSEFSINLQAGDLLLGTYRPSSRAWPQGIYRSRIGDEERQRLRQVLEEAAGCFDLEALRTGDTEGVRASMRDVLERLRPLSEFAKGFTIYLCGNAHIDLAWLWRVEESKLIAANTFRSVLNNMEEFPGLVFAQSQAQAYEWVEKNDPELFEEIRKAAAAGNWEPVGGMWVEPDCNLPAGESFVRQLLSGQLYFQEKFGKSPWLGWNVDSFGFNWNLPQIYARSGIKAFITCKLGWNDTTVFPYQLFWWEGPDGSRILGYLPPGGYVGTLQPEGLVSNLLRFEANTGLNEVLVLFGLGDHGGGPNREMLQRMEMLNRQPVFPKLVFSTAQKYLGRLMESDLSNLPVWKDELYLETHRGTYTTQALAKKYNRRCEAFLETAERAASVATLVGAEYPKEELERAWKIVLLNQFHDILPGSSIAPVYQDAREQYELAEELLERIVEKAMTDLAHHAGIEANNGRFVLVFNPLSWERGGLVRLSLPRDFQSEFAVKGSDGEIIPHQTVLSDDGLDRRLLFLAKSVPSIGYQVYFIEEAEPTESDTDLSAGEWFLENSRLRVEVNPSTGNISRIFDKRAGREILEQGKEGNRLELLENIPSDYDAWNIGYTGRSWTVDRADSVELVETGPVRAVFRVKKSFLGLSKADRAPTEGFPSSFFVQDLTLYADAPRLDIAMRCDWWEDHTLLKVGFPLSVESPTATFEMPYGSIERPTTRNNPWEKARFEVPVHRWGDISAEDFGVSLLNDCKYGMDVGGNVVRLTLLTSPLWPDPSADRGKHSLNYSIYPHSGDWREGRTSNAGQEFNLPLVAKLVEPAEGGQTAPISFFSIKPDGTEIRCIKQSEDGGGLILRIVETAGETCEVELQCPTPIRSASEVDLLENEIAEAQTSGRLLKFVIRPYEIRSFKIILEEISVGN
jgi:alpha-mannosidase